MNSFNVYSILIFSEKYIKIVGHDVGIKYILSSPWYYIYCIIMHLIILTMSNTVLLLYLYVGKDGEKIKKDLLWF